MQSIGEKGNAHKPYCGCHKGKTVKEIAVLHGVKEETIVLTAETGDTIK